MNCYLCNYNVAPHPAKMKDTFNNHLAAKNPKSNKLCDRCYHMMIGDYQRVKYRDSLVWSRNFSYLLVNSRDLTDPRNQPYFVQEEDGYRAFNPTTRESIRDFLIEPPEPPFSIVIAESGQKHLLFMAIDSYSRDIYEVIFEQNKVIINRAELINMINIIELLLGYGMSKTELLTGELNINRFSKNRELLDSYTQHQNFLEINRKKPQFEIAIFVAQKPEMEIKEDDTIAGNGTQISLFEI